MRKRYDAALKMVLSEHPKHESYLAAISARDKTAIKAFGRAAKTGEVIRIM